MRAPHAIVCSSAQALQAIVDRYLVQTPLKLLQGIVMQPDIHIGRVIKQYQGQRVVDALRQIAQGSQAAVGLGAPR